MIRRPPRSTLDRSSAASDVYKRQVLLHAICDAMLGALCLGDIGVHFPDTDLAYKGIDSKILLQKTAELIANEGYTVVNLSLIHISEPTRPY